MADLSEVLKSADWKAEKHVPVIECADEAAAGEAVQIVASVGKEITHPNTTAHHISWIELYFLPDGETVPVQLGKIEFSAHGASAQGADTSGIYTDSFVTVSFKTDKSGTILALSYCNIHGLWKNSKEIKVK